MTVPYFGPEVLRKPYEIRVPTPVGERCSWCDEPIVDGDVGTLQGVAELGEDGELVAKMRPLHYECSMRSVVGSVAHVSGRCSCAVPGATEGDPEGLTVREAARAALACWLEVRHG